MYTFSTYVSRLVGDVTSLCCTIYIIYPLPFPLLFDTWFWMRRGEIDDETLLQLQYVVYRLVGCIALHRALNFDSWI